MDTFLFLIIVSLIPFFIPALIGRSIGIALLNLLILPSLLAPPVAFVLWLVCLFAAFMTRNRVERRRQHKELLGTLRAAAGPATPPARPITGPQRDRRIAIVLVAILVVIGVCVVNSPSRPPAPAQSAAATTP